MLGSCQIVDDEGEVVRHLERQLGIKGRRDRVAGDAAQAERVAVGRRLGQRIHADIAARAALVLDHPLLAGDLRHLGAEDAGQGVGGAAGRERVDVADRLVGVGHLGGRRSPGAASARSIRPARRAARRRLFAVFTWFPPRSSAKVPNRPRAVDGFQRNWRVAPFASLEKPQNLVTLAPYRGTAVGAGARAGVRKAMRGCLGRIAWAVACVVAIDWLARRVCARAIGQHQPQATASASEAKPKPFDVCSGLTGANAPTKVAACTDAIKDGKLAAGDLALAYLNRGLSEKRAGQRRARAKDDYKAAIRIFNELILGSPMNPYYLHPARRDLSDDRRGRPRHPRLQRRHPSGAARDLSADQPRRRCSISGRTTTRALSPT